MKSKTKRSALTLGAIVTLSLAASPVVMANPFQSNSLRSSDLLAENSASTKPASAKCGAKMKDGKCGGKAESKPSAETKSKDAKCGKNCPEAKVKGGTCGANCAESKAKDGKCGQGTCGGKK